MLTNNSLIFIEGKQNQLFVYVYLRDFKMEKALTTLDFYIPRYENKDFKKIKIFCWNRCVPGDFLSMFRRNINRRCTRLLLRGARYIEASFDYINDIKVLNEPITVL